MSWFYNWWYPGNTQTQCEKPKFVEAGNLEIAKRGLKPVPKVAKVETLQSEVMRIRGRLQPVQTKKLNHHSVFCEILLETKQKLKQTPMGSYPHSEINLE